MIISQLKQIADIQADFSAKFPHLKIEFYEQKHEIGEGSPADLKISPYKTLAEIGTIQNDANISIHGNLKTASLEQEFEEKFGIHAQVFRKAGKIWLQTTNTDNWTLAEQEEKGQEY